MIPPTPGRGRSGEASPRTGEARHGPARYGREARPRLRDRRVFCCAGTWRACDWTEWREESAHRILAPEHAWEGAGLSIEPPVRGEIDRVVCQLRDPCVYEEAGRTYLLYCGGGESGIGIAEVLGL